MILQTARLLMSNQYRFVFSETSEEVSSIVGGSLKL